MTENEEAPNTQGKKELFLQALETTRGMIMPAADKVGISRSSVYVWEREDKDFKKKVTQIKKLIPRIVEDRFLAKVYEGNPKLLIYYLEHNHPKYRKKKKSESVAHIYHHVEGRDAKKDVSGKTLEEQLYEIAAKRKFDAQENGQP